MTRFEIWACLPTTFTSKYGIIVPCGIIVPLRVEVPVITVEQAPVAVRMGDHPALARRYYAGQFWAPIVYGNDASPVPLARGASFGIREGWSFRSRLNPALFGVADIWDDKNISKYALNCSYAELPKEVVLAESFTDLVESSRQALRSAVIGIGDTLYYRSGEPLIGVHFPAKGPVGLTFVNEVPTAEGPETTCFRFDQLRDAQTFLDRMQGRKRRTRLQDLVEPEILLPAALKWEGRVDFPRDAIRTFLKNLPAVGFGHLPIETLSAIRSLRLVGAAGIRTAADAALGMELLGQIAATVEQAPPATYLTPDQGKDRSDAMMNLRANARLPLEHWNWMGGQDPIGDDLVAIEELADL